MSSSSQFKFKFSIMARLMGWEVGFFLLVPLRLMICHVGTRNILFAFRASVSPSGLLVAHRGGFSPHLIHQAQSFSLPLGYVWLLQGAFPEVFWVDSPFVGGQETTVASSKGSCVSGLIWHPAGRRIPRKKDICLIATCSNQMPPKAGLWLDSGLEALVCTM